MRGERARACEPGPSGRVNQDRQEWSVDGGESLAAGGQGRICEGPS